MKSKIILLVATLLGIIGFLIAMHVPLEYIPIATRYDKYYHGLFFFIWTVMLLIGVQRHWSVIVVISVSVAGLSELSQLLSPVRKASFADLYSDFLGIATALFLFRLYKVVTNKRRKVK